MLRSLVGRKTGASMYVATLFVRSLLRWLIVVALLLQIGLAAWGAFRGGAFPPWQKRLLLLLIGSYDLQVVVGLWLLLFVSPLTAAALEASDVALETRVMRYFVLEHPVMTILAAAVLHIGHFRQKRAADPRVRERRLLAWLLVAALILFISVPWPFYPEVGRPWLP